MNRVHAIAIVVDLALMFVYVHYRARLLPLWPEGLQPHEERIALSVFVLPVLLALRNSLTQLAARCLEGMAARVAPSHAEVARSARRSLDWLFSASVHWGRTHLAHKDRVANTGEGLIAALSFATELTTPERNWGRSRALRRAAARSQNWCGSIPRSTIWSCFPR